jgi:hypothetical protein
VFDPGSVVKELNPESGVEPFKSNSAGRTKPKHGKFILTLVLAIGLTSCFVYRPIGFVDFVFRRAVVAAARESSGRIVKLGIRRRGFGSREDQFGEKPRSIRAVHVAAANVQLVHGFKPIVAEQSQVRVYFYLRTGN